MTNEIEWYFNNTVVLRRLTTLYGNTLAFSRDFRTLTISNLNYDIAGRISVTARNLVGSNSDYVDLIIEGTLRIIVDIIFVYNTCYTYIKCSSLACIIIGQNY